MPRTVTLLFFIILLFQSGTVKAASPTSDLPPAEEAVKKFYTQYEQYQYDTLYATLARKREGWVVIIHRFASEGIEPIKEYVFYKRGDSTYANLPLEKKKNNEPFVLRQYLDQMDSINFSTHAYYGYDGWYKDVIKDLADKKSKSDDELYSLGRAYGHYANSLVLKQLGFADKSEIWHFPFGINVLSQKQIDQFANLNSKAQDCFRKIESRNPEYESIIGTIGTKLSADIMSDYHILLTLANDHAKKVKLPAALFSNDVLDFTRKRMESCPDNAILVAYGDMDFYPVLYLQHAEGFRRDIHLVNYQLLGVDRYIYAATQPVFDAKGIKISADTSMYKDGMNEALSIKDSTNIISMGEIAAKQKQSARNRRTYISCKGVFLDATSQANNDKAVKVGITRIVYFNNGKELYKNHWILLDILRNAKGRAICFSFDFDDQLEGLNNYLERRDYVWIYKD